MKQPNCKALFVSINTQKIMQTGGYGPGYGAGLSVASSVCSQLEPMLIQATSAGDFSGVGLRELADIVQTCTGFLFCEV